MTNYLVLMIICIAVLAIHTATFLADKFIDRFRPSDGWLIILLCSTISALVFLPLSSFFYFGGRSVASDLRAQGYKVVWFDRSPARAEIIVDGVKYRCETTLINDKWSVTSKDNCDQVDVVIDPIEPEDFKK